MDHTEAGGVCSQTLDAYLLRSISMLDYLAEMDLFRAYNLTLTFLGAGTLASARRVSLAVTARVMWMSAAVPAPANINVRL